MNINILENTEISSEYLNTLYEYNFISTINNCTRCQGMSSTCIDHIFLKTTHDIKNCLLPLIIQNNITDHYTIILQIVIGSEKPNLIKENNYYKNINTTKLKKIVSNQKWEEVYMATDIDTATDYFITVISGLLESCTSYVKILRSEKKRKCWITKAIVKSVNKKK